ncbi:MAG: hypothetical protein BA864_01330 [Desulfuromonadales bacterium C00003093]|nr:MAG: hypothetical protein BA864_01330 [Desulfuromonadales bacterium C00003093]
MFSVGILVINESTIEFKYIEAAKKIKLQSTLAAQLLDRVRAASYHAPSINFDGLAKKNTPAK